MSLSRENIVRAPFLRPTEEECGTSPTPEEEAILLGKEIKLPQVPEISEGVEPAKQMTTLRTSSPSPTPWSNCHPYQKAEESWNGICANTNCPGRLIYFYLQENDRVLEWWTEF